MRRGQRSQYSRMGDDSELRGRSHGQRRRNNRRGYEEQHDESEYYHRGQGGGALVLGPALRWLSGCTAGT